ncbi:MAG: hypothetical protein ACRDBY_11105 [Cetobacterium sp.]
MKNCDECNKKINTGYIVNAEKFYCCLGCLKEGGYKEDYFDYCDEETFYHGDFDDIRYKLNVSRYFGEMHFLHITHSDNLLSILKDGFKLSEFPMQTLKGEEKVLYVTEEKNDMAVRELAELSDDVINGIEDDIFVVIRGVYKGEYLHLYNKHEYDDWSFCDCIGLKDTENINIKSCHYTVGKDLKDFINNEMWKANLS